MPPLPALGPIGCGQTRRGRVASAYDEPGRGPSIHSDAHVGGPLRASSTCTSSTRAAVALTMMAAAFILTNCGSISVSDGDLFSVM